MKELFHRILSMVLLVTMLVTFIPFTATAMGASDYINAIDNGDFGSYYTYLSSQINDQSGIDESITANQLESKLSDSIFAEKVAHLQLISRCSVSVLNSFAATAEHKEFLNWLFGDTAVINKFLEGGMPRDGKALNALTIWETIWRTDDSSRSGINLTLAMATALEHANSIDTGWYQVNENNKATIIDPISRYNNFKTAHDAGKLYPVFDTLNVTQMRMVVDAWVTDSDLDWARSTYLGSHSIVSEKGVTRTFSKVYDRSNVASSGCELEYNSYNAAGVSVQNGALAYYGANATLSKVLSVGAVCGGISKYGVSIAKAYGVPAMPVGQPGHCAAIYNSTDGIWSFHYDIFGFGESFTHGGTIIPWSDPGKARYVDSSGNVSTGNFGPAYMLLYEDVNHNDVINGTSSIAKSEKLRLLANELKNPAAAQTVRIIAKEICPKNIQIWRDYIAGLKVAGNFTASDWNGLKSNIISTFASHPRPMNELLTSIQDYVLINATEEVKANYVISIFNTYEAVTDSQQVSIRNIIEQSMPTWMFDYIPAPAVTFSFSGSNSGRLVGFSKGMSFSIDGGKTFLFPSDTNYKLNINELNALTVDNDIWVRNKYCSTTDKGKMTFIDIKASDGIDIVVFGDDTANTIVGIDTTMEFSIDNGITWKMYTGSNLPSLSGNIAVKVRKAALSTTFAGITKELIFTDGVSTNPMVGKLSNVTYLSDISWVSAASGWGPVERDTSNGERGMGDGKNINIKGVTYTKGLGCHAASTIIYNLDKKYSRFVTDVGADNETGGSVQFEVLADGVSVYKSNVMYRTAAAEHVDLDVSNVTTLTLTVTDGGNGTGGDHADWAGAHLVLNNAPVPVVIEPKRYAGASRFETSVQVSKAGWQASQNVVLANAYGFADALTGVPFAYIKDAPILLTEANSIPLATSDEIKRLGAKNVYILGGTGVVSKKVEDELKEKGYNVLRLSGLDRFDTALQIGSEVLKNNSSKTAVLTTAYNYPDALAISSYAAMNKYPILFTEVNTLNSKTKEFIKSSGITTIIIPGGIGAVSENVANELNDSGITVERIGGSDRYNTAFNIVTKYKNSFKNEIMIATGNDFPDALAGGVLAAKKQIPILLVDKDSVKAEVKGYIKSNCNGNMYILGGMGVISDNLINSIIN